MTNLDEPSSSYDKEKYSSYLRRRTQYDERLITVTERYEKSLLALSGGSIAISLTFLEKIAIAPSEFSLRLIVGAWTALVFSIIFGFVSIFLSSKAVEFSRTENEDDYESYCNERAGKNRPKPTSRWSSAVFSKYVRIASLAATLSLISGIVLLCGFAAANLSAAVNQEEQAVSSDKKIWPGDKDSRDRDDIQKGSYTPERQEQEPVRPQPVESPKEDTESDK